MFLVSRLNMGYDAEEDRLRLACDNAVGERVVLWLTQRLRQSPARVSLSLMDDDCAEVQLRLDHSDLLRWQELRAACCQVAQWPAAGLQTEMLAQETDVPLHPRLLH